MYAMIRVLVDSGLESVHSIRAAGKIDSMHFSPFVLLPYCNYGHCIYAIAMHVSNGNVDNTEPKRARTRYFYATTATIIGLFFLPESAWPLRRGEFFCFELLPFGTFFRRISVANAWQWAETRNAHRTGPVMHVKMHHMRSLESNEASFVGPHFSSLCASQMLLSVSFFLLNPGSGELCMVDFVERSGLKGFEARLLLTVPRVSHAPRLFNCRLERCTVDWVGPLISMSGFETR